MSMLFKVSGKNTANGELTHWHWDTFEQANVFAKTLSENTQQEVQVLRLLCTWEPTLPPVACRMEKDVYPNGDIISPQEKKV